MNHSILHVTKMHGLGNSYIYVNEFEVKLQESELPSLARKLSDVHTGIGSDGMILIGPSKSADFRMRIFNKDGSEGKNCGNGLRCVAKYVFERKMIAHTSFSVETLSGIVEVSVHAKDTYKVQDVTVNMGKPRLKKKDIPMLGDPESQTIQEEVMIAGRTYTLTALSMGNPHAVMFVSNVADVPIEVIGPQIECAPLFPERINVGFVSITNRREINFRVWERGSGATRSCGTGACAAVAAGILNGWLDDDVPVNVYLPGGKLEIIWSSIDHHLYMNGPAEIIMEGDAHI